MATMLIIKPDDIIPHNVTAIRLDIARVSKTFEGDKVEIDYPSVFTYGEAKLDIARSMIRACPTQPVQVVLFATNTKRERWLVDALKEIHVPVHICKGW